MSQLMHTVCIPLGYLMKGCFSLLQNYGVAILAFTLLTKLLLLPLSVWVQKNSIRMVKIQPQVNRLRAEYYGDREKIAEEETKLYKTVGYRPFASLLPLLVQIFLLMCVTYIIKEPLTHILHLDGETLKALADALGVDVYEGQLAILQAVAGGALTEGMFPAEIASALPGIRALDLRFLGVDLGIVAAERWGIYTLVPLVAGVSSLLLCYVQNRINVLQQEQGKLGRYGTTVLSVGISLFLGFFVYSGVALYWVASNLFAILQQFVLNACIDPRRHVDYEALQKSREALAAIEALDVGEEKTALREHRKRERADYKRFFKVVNKHVVIYSERSGFYKYFEAILRGLLASSNLTVHYVTSDPDDAIFARAEKQPRIRPYYIGQKKLISLMMKMDADMVLMTTPDLNTYYIKRSLVRRDVCYVYVPHDMMSVHMTLRKGALDHFDTVFCAGEHVVREVRATEQIYRLPQKQLVEFGYPLAEALMRSYQEEKKTARPRERREILVAPSWQRDNILDSCIDSVLSSLLCDDYHITVRPHPEYTKRYAERVKQLTERYRDIPAERLTFELDFTDNRSIYTADLLITDWSGIAYEFSFATEKPVLFINTAMKVENPEWERIPYVPTRISLREQVGIALDKTALNMVESSVKELLGSAESYAERIREVREHHLYHFGSDGREGVAYILNTLLAKKKQREEKRG